MIMSREAKCIHYNLYFHRAIKFFTGIYCSNNSKMMLFSFFFFNYKYIKFFFSSQLSYAGVNYCTRYIKSPVCTWKCYVKKFKHFHQCPMIKICYDFVSSFFEALKIV